MMVNITIFPSEGGRPVTKSRAMWDQGLEGTGKPSGGTMRSLAPSTGRTRSDETPHILLKRGPPEAPAEEVESS